MSKSYRMNDKLKCTIYESKSGIVAGCSFDKYTKSNDYLNEISKLESLSKSDIEERLHKKHSHLDTQAVFIRKAVEAYTTEYIQYKNLKNELEKIQKSNEIQKFLTEIEPKMNQLTNESNDKTGSIGITNGVYTMKILYDKRNAKYDVYFILSIHEIYTGNMYENPLDYANRQSFSTIEQVQTFINNKLRKYEHLFLIKKAILAEHIALIHPRFIRELDIQIYQSKDAIMNAENEVKI